MQHKIIGDDVQGVIIALNPGETVQAEAGAMLYMTDSIEMQTQLAADTSKGVMGAVMSGVKRAVTGESLFVTSFTAQGAPGQVAFAAPYPGKIMPLNLAETGPMICQRDSFLCSDADVKLELYVVKNAGAAIFGGEGMFLQKLSGTGTVFIHSGGGLLPIDLAAGQSLRVDSGCMAAYTSEVTFDIQMAKGIKNMLMGGEGFAFARFTGPGRVYLQVLPFSRVAARIRRDWGSTGQPSDESKIGGIGGALLGGILNGD